MNKLFTAIKNRLIKVGVLIQQPKDEKELILNMTEALEMLASRVIELEGRMFAENFDNLQTFERYSLATFKRVTDTFFQRGTEYGDTLKNCQWLQMKAVAKKLAIQVKDEHYLALAMAVMVDMKYQRAEGGWKDDSIIDAIAYSAVLAEAMRTK